MNDPSPYEVSEWTRLARAVAAVSVGILLGSSVFAVSSVAISLPTAWTGGLLASLPTPFWAGPLFAINFGWALGRPRPVGLFDPNRLQIG